MGKQRQKNGQGPRRIEPFQFGGEGGLSEIFDGRFGNNSECHLWAGDHAKVNQEGSASGRRFEANQRIRTEPLRAPESKC